jgi:hypothetical protein
MPSVNTPNTQTCVLETLKQKASGSQPRKPEDRIWRSKLLPVLLVLIDKVFSPRAAREKAQ